MLSMSVKNTNFVGCPQGCWLSRDEDGHLICDCSGALKYSYQLRGAGLGCSPMRGAGLGFVSDHKSALIGAVAGVLGTLAYFHFR